MGEGKRRTFKCKVCGQEHAGLICTKFSSVKVMAPAQRKVAVAGLLTAPKPPKPAKKKKKAKKRKKTKAQTTPAPAAPVVPA